MSLFSRLLNLNTGNIPQEDFFTELVAYLFETNKEVLYAWLKDLNLFDTSAYSDTHISTQRWFEPLDGHPSASRLDFVIELVDDSNCDIIFIESKIGSPEGIESKINSEDGYPQLQKYAEILHGLPNFRHKFLLYITRDFEPKDKASIFKDIPESTVQFKQLRWHQFYRFLEAQADTMLSQEIILFMDEKRMAHNNQFSSIDVIALANFTKSLKLMEETMGEEVRQKFKKVLGAIKHKNTALSSVPSKGRYLMSAWMPDGKWWCGLGFILETSSLTDYPKVRLMLEVAPKSQNREEIIRAMKKICEQYGWQGYGLNDSQAWSGVLREKSLQEFLSQEDHVEAIKGFFLESLNELDKIKSQYSGLPWKAIQDDGEGATDLLLAT